MQTAEIIETSCGQSVRLPDEFRFHTDRVFIRRQGDAIVLEPAKPIAWPKGFFDAIAIVDAALARPDQGIMPPAPRLD